LPGLLMALAACVRPATPPPPDVQDRWANDTLASLTLGEKVGQMILARADGFFLHETAPELKTLEKAAAGGRIGGVVFFQGDPLATAVIANRLQSVARVPLLMASDYEWGAAYRVQGATRFPSAMAIGAGGNEEDVRFQAEVTAREARAMGIHLDFAPVLDLNVNPANSVINTRSYGEDPERVGQLGAAFIARAQEEGLLTTAKHFPGHGATAVDSHQSLPVLHLDRERLDKVELAPFRAAIAADVAAIMSAHMAIPALDGRRDRPATFSPEILQGLLRKEMQFAGLIVSDALDMGGARKGTWGGAVAVAAVKAGCDLLLVPPDPLVAWDAVLRAVRRGEIEEERIDGSVKRILAAKSRLDLQRRRTVDLRDVPRYVADPRFEERVQDIADRSITLLGNRGETLPFPAQTPPRLLLVSYVHEEDRRGPFLAAALEDELLARTEGLDQLTLTPSSASARVGELVQRATETDATVFASFLRARRSNGPTFPLELWQAFEDLHGIGKPVVLVSLGDPYVLVELPPAGALVAAYDFSMPSQRAVAKALFGEIDIGGTLPVRLSEKYPVGYGIPIQRRKMELQKIDSPKEVGFSEARLGAALGVLDEAVRSKAFPGGVVVVGREGKLVAEWSFGHLDYGEDSPRVTMDTIYDVASLTKIVVTATLAMVLYEKGELNLEAPVRDYLPEFSGDGKDMITVADLLAHSSGVLWWKDYYKSLSDVQPPAEVKRQYLEKISRLPLDYPPRSKSDYSDLGFILLGEILERVSGRSLDELAGREIFEPLGMERTFFNPPASLRPRIAPTEDDPWRGRVVIGEVHDENAFALGGVAPHAGLFSTGGDLALFAQMILNGGVYGGHRIVKRSTVELFTRPADLAPGSSRALGWDKPSVPPQGSSSGRYFSSSSFGHTGFTGTSLWIDPSQRLFVVLLTNRVHPSRDNNQIREVRSAFHDAVMEALTDIPQPRTQ
jgi:beta-glucosidase-like glycosyl hydrolase/CubicO group peptidase (beta-lactamase class C family)